ncbi:MAG: T9SS type A sorting domain-containing protein [Bacteroidia bacterium]
MKNVFMVLLLLFATISHKSYSQCSGWNNIQAQDSIFTNPFFGIALSPEADRLHRPYVYLATNVGGVKVYEKNTSGNQVLVATVPTTALGNLNASNLFQDSIWLYVCLGDIWDTTQASGLAIIDVSDPLIPVVLDYYMLAGSVGGAGAVSVRGNYAFLAANENGLIILDISNKNNIQYVSNVLFSINFPHTTPGAASMYNARGIDLNGNYAYICYDRGGLRVVDISNVNAPYQYSQYCFSNLIDKATAYNNVVIHNNIAYVAIDYYGMEILDISNPANIIQLGWWHPSTWADTTNNYTVWANSLGHCNELAYDSVCQMVYVASGKSDAVAIDVSNSSNPTTCQTFGSTSDDYGTWGIDLFDDTINLAYIWSPAFPPFSNYTGFKTLPVTCSPNILNDIAKPDEIFVTPNPASDYFNINYNSPQNRNLFFVLYDCFGKEVLREKKNSTSDYLKISTDKLCDGVYFLRAIFGETQMPFNEKIVVTH